jgi:hypothetical protein
MLISESDITTFATKLVYITIIQIFVAIYTKILQRTVGS